LLRSGSSEIRVDGDHGDAMNANVVLQIPALNDWLPDASGELYGRVLAQGRWPELNVDANVRGSSLRYATNHAEALTVNANVSRLQDPRGTLSVRGSKLTLGGLAFDTMNMQAQGEMSNHTFELNANGQPLTTHVRLHGGKTGTEENVGWSGNLDELILDVQNVARMALQQPVKIDYADQGVHVSQACLAGSDIHLCASGDTEKSGALRADYSLRNVPLALANTFSGSSASFDLSGTIDGEGRVQRDAQGHLQGQITVTSSRGAISRHAEPPFEGTETLLSYADLRLAAQLDGSNGNGTLSARLNDTGGLKGDVQLMGLGEVATQVRGRVNADLPSISVIEAFAPQLANVQGKLRVNLGVAGTIDEPQIDGTIAAEDLAADIPTVGLKLRKGQFTVEPRSASEFALNGRVSSGDGNLQFAGLATTQGRVQMNVSGKRFVAADIPGAHVEIDPTLTFSRSEDRMSLEGDLLIPAARIDMQKLPRTTSTQQASPDVIVIDEKTQEEAQAERIPLYASIRVSLGEKVELVGFGLDSKVAGELVVRESPGSPTTGSGELRVSGTYKAYGQDLTIRQGQLLFAGTPLDNPNLSIVAIRQVESVVAGLRIQGSARNPQLTVFSEPPMAQSNALAYLVTGKPLNEIGSGTGEGDAMQTAARSLGTAAGGLLAKNLGKRLGVDEVGVKDSEAIGGAALTVGQYLSPRLYLSYGVGLFEPGEVVTLRYKLSEAFTIEALNGPRDSRAGVEYRIER
jgi:translocation and assembly module TamB